MGSSSRYGPLTLFRLRAAVLHKVVLKAVVESGERGWEYDRMEISAARRPVLADMDIDMSGEYLIVLTADAVSPSSCLCKCGKVDPLVPTCIWGRGLRGFPDRVGRGQRSRGGQWPVGGPHERAAHLRRANRGLESGDGLWVRSK